jgi:CRP-like cAMP-binding protein
MAAENIIWQSIGILQKTMQERIQFSEEEMSLLMSFLKITTYKKNDPLIVEGAVENNIHFIVEGVTRSFFVKGNKDISFEFYFSGAFISSYASFLMRTPSGHSIEAFTQLTTVSMQHKDLMDLYEKSRKFEQFGRILTEELFKKTSERTKDLLSLTATERYVKLMNTNPQYVQEIPLKYLASYLNITPESLSRIRKTI